MSDTIKGFSVALESDCSEESAARIKEAIMCIRGVCAVEASIADGNDWMNRSQIAHRFSRKIIETVRELNGDKG